MAQTSTIILYTQPHCPACRRIKEFFAEHGVTYEELDVAEDFEARDDIWEVHGSQNTPTTVIDGEVFIGFRKEDLCRKLGIEAGKGAG